MPTRWKRARTTGVTTCNCLLLKWSTSRTRTKCLVGRTCTITHCFAASQSTFNLVIFGPSEWNHPWPLQSTSVHSSRYRLPLRLILLVASAASDCRSLEALRWSRGEKVNQLRKVKGSKITEGWQTVGLWWWKNMLIYVNLICSVDIWKTTGQPFQTLLDHSNAMRITPSRWEMLRSEAPAAACLVGCCSFWCGLGCHHLYCPYRVVAGEHLGPISAGLCG